MNPSPVNNNIRGVEFMRYSVSQESEQADVRLPGYVDYMLIVLNSVHRVPLLVVLAMVALVSLVGNVATIVVNVRRFVDFRRFGDLRFRYAMAQDKELYSTLIGKRHFGEQT